MAKRMTKMKSISSFFWAPSHDRLLDIKPAHGVAFPAIVVDISRQHGIAGVVRAAAPVIGTGGGESKESQN